MTRQELFTYVKTKYRTDPDYPWSDPNAVLRHAKSRKWYGLVMEIGRDRLGLPGSGTAKKIRFNEKTFSLFAFSAV